MRPSSLATPFLAAVLLLTAGCGPSAPKDGAAPAAAVAPTAAAMEADLKATLTAEPDFYVFKPLAELPADLAWQDGAALPEFADPKARKGGTLNYYIPDFPRTLRTIGPDATGGIRPYLLDYVEPPFIALLATTFFVTTLSLARGRVSTLQGMVHILLFLAWIVTILDEASAAG